MLIECPFCHTQVKFPEDKEGSKIRCPECSKVYVARPRGRAPSSGNPAGIAIGVGAVVLLGVIFFLVKGRKTPVAPPAPPPVVEDTGPAEIIDTDGWNSAPVVAVRDLYRASLAYDEERVKRAFDGARVATFLAERAAAAAAEQQTDAEAAAAAGVAPEDGDATEPAAAHEPVVWAELDIEQRDEFLAGVARELMDEEAENAPARWEPFDGRVLETDGTVALVHLDVSRTENDLLVSRTMAWRLAAVEERGERTWKIFAWERYISPEEAAAMRRARAKKYEKVTLSDGSTLYQAEPEPLEHLPDTPPELRKRIDETMVRMLDFSLRGPENSRAMRELIEIGRPALPALLTGLYATPITDIESATKVNLIDQALQGVTGEYMGYKPDPGLGVSEERRGAAVKAWFAWWWRKGERRFEERKEGVDMLEGLIVPTERDKREMERDNRPVGG